MTLQYKLCDMSTTKPTQYHLKARSQHPTLQVKAGVQRQVDAGRMS